MTVLCTIIVGIILIYAGLFLLTGILLTPIFWLAEKIFDLFRD